MEDIFLDAERDARFREFAELRDREDRPLTEAEACELETLIGEIGRAMVERDIVATAQYLGIPVEMAHRRITNQARDAAHFWSELTNDPERMAAEVKAAQAQHQVRAG